MSAEIYDKFLEFLKKDPQLTQFPSPDLHRRQPRSAGFIFNDNAEHVIYLIEDKRYYSKITFQWSSPEACQKIDQIKDTQNRPFCRIISSERLRDSSNPSWVRYF